MPEIFKSKPVPPPQVKKAVSAPPEEVSTGDAPPLASFMERPKGIHFETQEPGEEVLLLMRQHPVTNVGWISFVVILAVIPVLVGPLLLGANLLPPETPPGYIIVIPFLWYLITAGITLANFLRWYFNVYIVTGDRVVDIDWLSILYKRISSTQLEKIQDVTYHQAGILDSFFDFGNVYIQTAGNEPNFEFEQIPKPERVVRQINQILEHKRPVAVSV